MKKTIDTTKTTFPTVPPLTKKEDFTRINKEFRDSDTSPYPDKNSFLDDLESRRITEVARVEALVAAQKLKKTLSSNRLNIVTAESLTAGMIAKTLVDVPGEGATLMGGIIVYDTDMKRQMLQVSTKGVYSIKTAQQMATGALSNSRAMIALAVSGDAMPFPKEKNKLGVVYIGVALRLADKILTYGKKISVCDQKEVTNMCDVWKNLNTTGEVPSYAPYQLTALVADLIRNKTVAAACNEARIIIENEINKGSKWGTLPYELYDDICKPSWIIEERLPTSYNRDTSECEGGDEATIEIIDRFPAKQYPYYK